MGPEVLRFLREVADDSQTADRNEAREVGWLGELRRDRLINALAANYLDWRKVTVFGGTTEVKKDHSV